MRVKKSVVKQTRCADGNCCFGVVCHGGNIWKVDMMVLAGRAIPHPRYPIKHNGEWVSCVGLMRDYLDRRRSLMEHFAGVICPEYYTQFGTKHWKKGMLCAKVYNRAYMVRQISITDLIGGNDENR